MQVVPLQSRLALLDLLTPALAAWCHLYVNDIALDWWTQKADLREPDSPGYAPQPIFGWQTAILVGMFASSQADPVLFTRDDPPDALTVAGYFITNQQTGDLLTVERSDLAPISFGGAGNPILIVPRLQLRMQQLVSSEPELPTVGAGGAGYEWDPRQGHLKLYSGLSGYLGTLGVSCRFGEIG